MNLIVTNETRQAPVFQLESFRHPDDVGPISRPDCMECGFPIEDGDRFVFEPGYPPSRHEPGAPPYIAHEECPKSCTYCGEPVYVGDDLALFLGDLVLCGTCRDGEGL